MLSKCHSSKRNVTKGWFLKLNKDPVLEMTICHLPYCEEITRGHLCNHIIPNWWPETSRSSFYILF